MRDTSNKTLGNDAAAVYIGVSPKTLATWRCTKAVQIPHVKIGRRVVYLTDTLDAWLDAHAVAGA